MPGTARPSKSLFVWLILCRHNFEDNEDGDSVFAETAAEAAALSRLRHVNMMRFIGICYLEDENAIAIVTELCEVKFSACFHVAVAMLYDIECMARGWRP